MKMLADMSCREFIEALASDEPTPGGGGASALVAAIGTALGLVFGKYLHRFVVTTVEVDMVMFIRKADPSSYVYSAVLSLVFAMIVNLLMRRKVRRINMVESLKSAE